MGTTLSCVLVKPAEGSKHTDMPTVAFFAVLTLRGIYRRLIAMHRLDDPRLLS